jgi:hypothetical protein
MPTSIRNKVECNANVIKCQTGLEETWLVLFFRHYDLNLNQCQLPNLNLSCLISFIIPSVYVHFAISSYQHKFNYWMSICIVKVKKRKQRGSFCMLYRFVKFFVIVHSHESRTWVTILKIRGDFIINWFNCDGELQTTFITFNIKIWYWMVHSANNSDFVYGK